MCTYVIKINDPEKIRLFDEFLKDNNLKAESKSFRNDPNDLSLTGSIRQNWDASFKAMSKNNDDTLLIKDNFLVNEWDASEWEWK